MAVFLETEYVTVPSPVPVAPDLIVIQVTLLAATQQHPDPVVEVTLTEASPPEWLGDADVGDMG